MPDKISQAITIGAPITATILKLLQQIAAERGMSVQELCADTDAIGAENEQRLTKEIDAPST